MDKILSAKRKIRKGEADEREANQREVDGREW